MQRPDQRNIIHLHFAHAQPVSACALAGLNDDERAQAARLPDGEARSYVQAHLLLREMLRDIVGLEKPRFHKTQYGKPYIEGSDICFNLSHTEDMVAVALCFGREIGVDIEKMNLHRADEAVAQHMFTPAEFDLWAKAEDKGKAFFRIWTLKESVMKATGLGSALALRSFDVTLASPQIVHSPDGAVWHCESGFVGQDYAWALATGSQASAGDLSLSIRMA